MSPDGQLKAVGKLAATLTKANGNVVVAVRLALLPLMVRGMPMSGRLLRRFSGLGPREA